MVKLNTYSSKGVKTTPTNMPKSWQEEENLVLLAQAIRVYEARRHPGLSKTKTRGEVSFSTRKIYRQKGTGMARHGAKSAPIFVGGGKAHGPKGVKRRLSLPKKMRQKALNVALSMKINEGRVILVDKISSLTKTKEAASLIQKIVVKEKEIGKKSRFTFAIADKNKAVEMTLRNIENVEVVPFRNLNAYNVYLAGVLIVDKEALKKNGKGGSGSTSKTVEKKSVKNK